MFGYDWPRLHAALNDLPTALLVAAVFFDLVGTVTCRAPFRQVGFWTLVLGVLGAGAAVLTGLQAEGEIAHGEAVHRVMERHEQLGLVTLGVFAVLALWRIAREGRMAGAERALSVALAVGGVGVLFATGMYGGRLVFDHAAGIPTAVIERELAERSEGHHQHGAGAPSHDQGARAHGHAAGGDHHGDKDHHAEPVADSGAAAGAAVSADTAAPAGHVDPPGTPPHTHRREAGAHTHPPGTPPHQD